MKATAALVILGLLYLAFLYVCVAWGQMDDDEKRLW